MDLQQVQEGNHDNILSHKNRHKWDAADPKQSLTNIREFFKSLCGRNKAPCSYMLCPNIVPLEHKNQAIGLWSDPNKMMIKQCLIIPIDQHGVYFGGTDAELLKDLFDLGSPEYVVDSVMCYTKLKLIVKKTPAETCINEFSKSCNVHAAFKKLQVMFLGPGFTQCSVLGQAA